MKAQTSTHWRFWTCLLVACLVHATLPLERSLLAQQAPPAPPGRWLSLKQTVAVSLRGISVVSGDVFWASGAEGTVLRSRDGGKTITKLPVWGAMSNDFRDLHAFDAKRAILMTAGQPARFYATADGGMTWSIVYDCPDKRSFFNSFAFWDERRGIAFSDPIDGKLLIVTTGDGGQNWQPLDETKRPATFAAEHGYAASGTCLAVAGQSHIWIGLGGHAGDNRQARVLRSGDAGQTWSAAASSLPGSESAGIFSIYFSNERHGVAVGGDYKMPEEANGVVALTDDGGATWTTPRDHGLRGYRSCVARAITTSGDILIASGPTGSDWSADAGRRWNPLDDDGFHALGFTRDGRAGFAVGADGRVARWVSDDSKP